MLSKLHKAQKKKKVRLNHMYLYIQGVSRL